MKRLDEYKKSRKRALMANLTSINNQDQIKTGSMISETNNMNEGGTRDSDNINNLVTDCDFVSSVRESMGKSENTKQFSKNVQAADNTYGPQGQTINDGIAEFVDKINIDYYITSLPPIEGISYDRQLNCFKSKVPSKFTTALIEDSFSVTSYGLKNAWLKAIGSLYTNIAFIIFDYPQIISKLRFSRHLNTAFSKDILGGVLGDDDSVQASNINGSRMTEITNGNFSLGQSGQSNGSFTDLPSSVEDVFEALNNSNNMSTDATNTNDTKDKDEYSDYNPAYDPLLCSSRGRRLQLPEDEDPKKIAESLKPWHKHIFWIPSICRWRTLYYDANSVKHSKTFTPAFFGGVREAYYAALEFRHMIDNMDKLTQSKIRRKWVQSSLPLGMTSMGADENVDSVGTKCGNCGSSCGCVTGNSGPNGASQGSKAVESGLDAFSNGNQADVISTLTKSSSNMTHLNGKIEPKSDFKLDIKGIREFNKFIGCGQMVVDNLAKYLAHKRLQRAEDAKTDQPEDETNNSVDSGTSVNEHSPPEDKKPARGNRAAKRGRPYKRSRQTSRSRTNDESKFDGLKKLENKFHDDAKVDYDDQPVEDSSCGHLASHDHSGEKILYERSIDEKYNCCMRFKSEGNESFNNGDYKQALMFYNRVIIQLDYTFPEDEEWIAKFDSIKLKTYLNMAIANYKLGNFSESVQNCSEVLSIDPDNTKALTRRCMCYAALSKFKEAKEDLANILRLDENSEFAKSQMERIKQMEVDQESQQRNLYKSMFQTRN
ncbi:hypothetical protein MACK_000936 [Theileria orientalis]|uniref:Uncharacterized protein n=1 Tax=Theileria orientalis TaxID=68886 RepID=A0A976MAA9_THEOR|nr:hypothetical protein MACK_000936 [Theileria orientalis]